MEVFMRRLRFLSALGASLFALTLCLLLAGCGGGKDKEKDLSENDTPAPTKKTKKTGSGGSSASSKQFVEGKGTTTIKGKITLKGGDPTPVLEALTQALLKQIAGKPDDKTTCMAGSPSEITGQAYRIGDNKQVGNVFVWIMPPSTEYAFKVDSKEVDYAKAHPVEIGQPHCAFQPHVAVSFPSYYDPKTGKLTPTGQKFIIVNNAKISHNTLVSGGPRNPGGGATIAPDGKKEDIELRPDKDPVQFKCNIHPWMDGYMRVFDHPFATLSKSDTAPKDLRVEKGAKDFGTFEIKNAPAGVKVRLFAWHEKAGWLTPSSGEEIETKDGEMTKDFELEVKP
jgi:hypothetical protein